MIMQVCRHSRRRGSIWTGMVTAGCVPAAGMLMDWASAAPCRAATAAGIQSMTSSSLLFTPPYGTLQRSLAE